MSNSEELQQHEERTRAASQLTEALKCVFIEPLEVYVGNTSIRLMCRQLDREKWLKIVAAFLRAEDGSGGWSSDISERYMVTPTDGGNKLVRIWQLRFQSEDLIGALHMIAATFMAVLPVVEKKRATTGGGVVDFTIKNPPDGGPPVKNDPDYAPAIRRGKGYTDPKGAGGWALTERNMGPK